MMCHVSEFVDKRDLISLVTGKILNLILKGNFKSQFSLSS